jgi:AmiR/NasT family two-component response regulator
MSDAAAAPTPKVTLWTPFTYSVFRAIWIAGMVSNVGTWMQNVAGVWLVTTLTTSALLVALMQTATSLPSFLLSMPSGAMADLVDRRKLLLLTQGFMAVVATGLGALTLLDGISAAERLTKNHIAPVVLLTAFSQKELVERATEAGALAYVVKPFTPNDLLPAIEIALARYAQIITLEAEVSDLVERFETRKLVDRAKGLLNEKMGLSEPEAFRWIQKASMDRRLTMHDVAQAIIEQLNAKK